MSVPVYVPLTKAISIPRATAPLVVHGLTIEDLTGILHDNLTEVVDAVEQFSAGMNATFSTTKMDGFVLSIFKGFPKLTAQVIARAADDPDGAEQIARYPLGVQVQALLAVAELSLEEMPDLSDPSPALANLVRQVTGALANRHTNESPTSTGTSDEHPLLSPLPDNEA